MKRIIGTTLFTIGFTITVTAMAVAWVIWRKDCQSDAKISGKIYGINNIGVEYNNRRVFLNIQGDIPISCDEVYKLLDITPILVEGKTYIPSCGEVGENSIQVIYSLENEI